MSLDFRENINNFIIYIKNINNENIYNLISEHIDNLIKYNTKEKNILIINYYAGSINEAINKHYNLFGLFSFTDVDDFYNKLAFVSIYEMLCHEIGKNFNDDIHSNASTEESFEI